eukprot:15420636-Alexandrium_andersonii.AAC.1
MGPGARDVACPGEFRHRREGLPDVAFPLGRVGLDEPKPWTDGLGGVRKVREVGRGRPKKGEVGGQLRLPLGPVLEARQEGRRGVGDEAG